MANNGNHVDSEWQIIFSVKIFFVFIFIIRSFTWYLFSVCALSSLALSRLAIKTGSKQMHLFTRITRHICAMQKNGEKKLGNGVKILKDTHTQTQNARRQTENKIISKRKARTDKHRRIQAYRIFVTVFATVKPWRYSCSRYCGSVIKCASDGYNNRTGREKMQKRLCNPTLITIETGNKLFYRLLFVVYRQQVYAVRSCY